MLMKKILNLLFTIITIFILNIEAKENTKDDFFITDREYGQMLYSHPRGIGCNLCHGLEGRESLIYNYTHKGKKVSLIAPNINNLPFKTFKKGIRQPGTSIMPKYDLTDTEIQTLYSYLKKDNDVTRR